MESIRHEEYMRRMARLGEPRQDDPLETTTLGDLIGAEDDMVNKPPHYQSAEIECIDAIRAVTGDGFHHHLTGTVIKYIWRHRYKGKPLEDLKKARWYLDRLIEDYDPAER